MIHICRPRIAGRSIHAAKCPDCGRRSRFLCWHYEWYGSSQVCLRCGRRWEDGEWMPLDFVPGSRQKSIDNAKARWRRDAREVGDMLENILNLHENIAADVWPQGGLLRCGTCGRERRFTAVARHGLTLPPVIEVDEGDLDEVVQETGFRMLRPHEIHAGMGFPDGYKVTGTQREQVRQYGNANPPPVEHAILQRCVAALQ